MNIIKMSIFALIIIIIITFAIGCTEINNNEQKQEPPILLTIKYDDFQINYTLNDIESFPKIEGSGYYIKVGWLPEIKIDGPLNYTGVEITSLFEDIENLPEIYKIEITSSDGWISNFSYNEILGNVDIYNESGNITNNGEVSMILAYMKDGKYINKSDGGPLRIAFIDEGAITSSNLWIKMVVSIEIISS